MQTCDDSTGRELKEASPSYRIGSVEVSGNHSLSLDDSLAMTPWERILANDDMINFGDSLRVAMEKRNAKSR
jgi:hypothetical protein